MGHDLQRFDGDLTRFSPRSRDVGLKKSYLFFFFLWVVVQLIESAFVLSVRAKFSCLGWRVASPFSYYITHSVVWVEFEKGFNGPARSVFRAPLLTPHQGCCDTKDLGGRQIVSSLMSCLGVLLQLELLDVVHSSNMCHPYPATWRKEVSAGGGHCPPHGPQRLGDWSPMHQVWAIDERS